MSQSSYFKPRPELLTLRKVGRGKPEILKNAYKCRRYAIDVTGLDPLSLWSLVVEFSALASLVLLDVLGR